MKEKTDIKTKEEVFGTDEVTDLDLEKIAEDIKTGCTSGNFGSDEHRVSWEIKINKWRD